jgi:hypothetical protein
MKKETGIISLIMLLALAGMLVVSPAAADYSGSAQVNFSTELYCQQDAASAFWVNVTSGMRLDGTTNCGTYSHPPEIRECCPLTDSLTCNFTSNRCYDGSAIVRCENYPAEQDCNADGREVGPSSVSNSSVCGVSHSFMSGLQTCFNVTNCGCYWNGSSCLASINDTISCYTPIPGDGGSSSGSSNGFCYWSSSVVADNCNTTNTIIVKSTAKWIRGSVSIPPAYCTNITRTYQCPPVAKLSFISNASLIAAIIIIIGIYIYLRRRRNLKSKKRR